jgi:toxin ParE1/3/4
MKFTVIITTQAQQDLEGIYAYIAADSPETALTWYLEMLDAIESLATFPQRCPLAPESPEMLYELRHLIRGNYRIIYETVGSEVRVVQVRHARRRPASPDELTN